MELCELPNLTDIVELRADEGDGRTVEGRVVPWDTPAALFGDRVFEVFRRGALTRDLNAKRQTGVPLYLTHNSRSLIGRSIDHEDREDGHHMQFRVSETPQGEEALTLIRDGVLHSFSIGFIPMPDKTKIIDEADRKVTYERQQVKLDHVALVPNPAYRTARVLSLRDGLEGLDVDALQELIVAYRDGRIQVAEPATEVVRPKLDELRERYPHLRAV